MSDAHTLQLYIFLKIINTNLQFNFRIHCRNSSEVKRSMVVSELVSH